MTNSIYGPHPEPERGEPVRLLADAIEVLRPEGASVMMDLVALAEVTIGTERLVLTQQEAIDVLTLRVRELEMKLNRAERVQTSGSSRIMQEKTDGPPGRLG